MKTLKTIILLLFFIGCEYSDNDTVKIQISGNGKAEIQYYNENGENTKLGIVDLPYEINYNFISDPLYIRVFVIGENDDQFINIKIEVNNIMQSETPEINFAKTRPITEAIYFSKSGKDMATVKIKYK